MKSTLYKTDLYEVYLEAGKTEYEVINLETFVIEHKNTSLPRAIIVAQEYTHALKQLLPKRVEEEKDTVTLEGVFDETNVVQLRKDRTE